MPSGLKAVIRQQRQLVGGSLGHLSKTFLNECKQRLIESKVDILNRIKSSRETLSTDRVSGDSADHSHRLMEENELLSFQAQWRKQLVEIEHALSRIENGQYGICEETEEPIEPSRLRAIPWTRFSVEGAEIRDAH